MNSIEKKGTLGTGIVAAAAAVVAFYASRRSGRNKIMTFLLIEKENEPANAGR